MSENDGPGPVVETTTLDEFMNTLPGNQRASDLVKWFSVPGDGAPFQLDERMRRREDEKP